MNPLLFLAILGWISFFVMSAFAFFALRQLAIANKRAQETLDFWQESDANWQEIIQDILNEGEEWKNEEQAEEKPTHGEN